MSAGTNESSNISRELFPREVEQAGVTSTEQEGGRSLGMDAGEEDECGGDMTVEEARVNGEMGYEMSGCDRELDSVLKAVASLTVSGGTDEGEGGEEGDGEGKKENRKTISHTMTKPKCVVGNSPPLPTAQPMETEPLYSRASTHRVLGNIEYDSSTGSNVLGGGRRSTFLLG